MRYIAVMGFTLVGLLPAPPPRAQEWPVPRRTDQTAEAIAGADDPMPQAGDILSAPRITCIPDLVISDLEPGARIINSNRFVFLDALDLDEFAVDADTPAASLAWSFIETGGATIRINGKGSVDPANVKNPGANNIRAWYNSFIDIENIAAKATSPTRTMTTIDLYVSDGNQVDSQTVEITTVNVGSNATSASQDDELITPIIKDYAFDTGEQDWTHHAVDYPGIIIGPSFQWEGGALTMTEGPDHGANIVYGSYESPKAPADAVHPRLGCVLRARYRVRSTAASDAATPGFRLHAVTKHVAFDKRSGTWVPDFRNFDFLDEQYVQYSTLNFVGNYAGRIPGAGKEYVLLYYPNQSAETLLSTSTITYFTFELLDAELGPNRDSGRLLLDSVVIDSIDRPALDKGTELTSFTTRNFSAADWTTGPVALLTVPDAEPNTYGLSAGVVNGDLVVNVGPGNQWFEAFMFTKKSAPLEPGKYYRTIWELSATAEPSYSEPRVRLAVVSDYFTWLCVKEQQGGAAYAGLGEEPAIWELWFVAPSPDPKQPGATLTEGMKLRFGTYQRESEEFPVYSPVGGSIRAHGLTTHVFEAMP